MMTSVQRPSQDADATHLSQWEAAYVRFETPEEEIEKFCQRLRSAGAGEWLREAQIVELFCGRGNGMRALHRLGFMHVAGIDLSEPLVRRYDGPGTVIVGDCRHLPFADASRDVLIVQGGLHHLPVLPDDLDQALSEVSRVLRVGGRFVAVEPWLTSFLRVVHTACRIGVARRVSVKLDALATMIEHERDTYERWLESGGLVKRTFRRYFETERETIGWGKLSFVGRKVVLPPGRGKGNRPLER